MRFDYADILVQHISTNVQRFLAAQPGSSGSPVFDDAWRVVAVHHAGGNLVTSPAGERRFINEGILAEHARRALGL